MEKTSEREFSEKNLLITGATSGIGRATAVRFAQAGANVAAAGRDELSSDISNRRCLI
ncbi:MAG: SDR family NAD(P)-dependent oxidoreductase [Pyrinomonadaceae bacterium]